MYKVLQEYVKEIDQTQVIRNCTKQTSGKEKQTKIFHQMKFFKVR